MFFVVLFMCPEEISYLTSLPIRLYLYGMIRFMQNSNPTVDCLNTTRQNHYVGAESMGRIRQVAVMLHGSTEF